MQERLRREREEEEERRAFEEQESWQARYSDEVQRKQDQARRQAARDAAEYNKRMVRHQARAFVN